MTARAHLPPDRAGLTSTWMDRGIDLFFVAVVGLSAARDPGRRTLVVAGVILAIYATRLLPHQMRWKRIVWLGVVTATWMAAVVFVSVDFVWVSVPLLFLHLLTFPIAIGLAAVAAITSVVVAAEALDDGLTAAEVAGPVLGAGFAIVACVSYRRLAAEHEHARRALDELEETRHELARSEHERGVLDERRRVAREVHDTIAQDLASILLLSRSPQSSDSSARIEGLASTALHEARRIVDALGPLELEAWSLPTALAQFEHTAEHPGPNVEFTMTGTQRELPQPSEAMLLRVAQGAIANSREHSQASTVFVTLSYLDEEVAVDVVDDGIGFEIHDVSGCPAEGSFGLSVMRDRAAQVGGTLVIESTPGSGTAIHAAVPAP